jgi:TorA maturation chaperone TorD
MDIAEDPQLMPDHLAVELEVLAYLLALSGREMPDCRRLDADIGAMVGRLLDWVKPYHPKLLSLDPPEIYRAACGLLVRLLEHHDALRAGE